MTDPSECAMIPTRPRQPGCLDSGKERDAEAA